MNVNKIRDDFSILKDGKLIYFDSACMSLKPRQVVDKINEYYNEYPACVGRSSHRLGRRASEEYNQSRTLIQKFIGAKNEEEVIFTRNGTESMNMAAKCLDYDVVITTDKEHNSNHVPWMQPSKKKEIIYTEKDIHEQLKELFSIHKGKKIILSMVHTSNMDGTTTDAKDLIRMAHDHNALVMLDAAQSISHRKIDVRKLDIDLMAFSGHKMLGPTGTGILYAKKDILEGMRNYNVGGDTVKDTFYDEVQFEDLPHRFEAGLQDYAGIIGFGAAVKYLQKYIDDIEDHQIMLNRIMTDGLKDKVTLIGPADPKQRAGIFNFTSRINHHEMAGLLDSYANIMVRSGRHCVHSWYNAHNIDGSTRASVYVYNTTEEAKKFVDAVNTLTK